MSIQAVIYGVIFRICFRNKDRTYNRIQNGVVIYRFQSREFQTNRAIPKTDKHEQERINIQKHLIAGKINYLFNITLFKTSH